MRGGSMELVAHCGNHKPDLVAYEGTRLVPDPSYEPKFDTAIEDYVPLRCCGENMWPHAEIKVSKCNRCGTETFEKVGQFRVCLRCGKKIEKGGRGTVSQF